MPLYFQAVTKIKERKEKRSGEEVENDEGNYWGGGEKIVQWPRREKKD